MKRSRPFRYVFPIACGLGVISAWTGLSSGQQVPPQAPPSSEQAVDPSEDDFEVQSRGPIHEAFAEEYNNDPEPGIIISQQPPEAIDELPPEQMPEGDNVEWIPGYWAWDDDLEDFLWVSGVWRDIPPNQRWVPGYWTSVEGGFQWIAGFWTAAEIQQVDYQPYPPASLEYGPTTEAPGDNHFWVPGCWIYTDNDYRWRPGYWNQGYDDWVWVPARYVWTPYGAVYARGYWDYRLSRRGVLFSPVYFRNHRRYRYTPSAVVNVGAILVHLFVRPGYHHYYYGDYYGGRYADRGFRPWYSYYSGPRYYDPLLTYYTFRYGHDNFLNRVGGWHRFYNDNERYRPPRTLSGQQDFLARFDDQDDAPRRQALLSSRLDEFVKNTRESDDGLRFRQLDEDTRHTFAASRDQGLQQLREMRRELESRVRDRQGADQQAEANQPERRGRIRETLKLPAIDTERLRRPTREATPERQIPTERGENQNQTQRRARPQTPATEAQPRELIRQDQLPDRLRDLQNRFRNERSRGATRPNQAAPQQQSPQDRASRALPNQGRDTAPQRRQTIQQPRQQQSPQQRFQIPKVNPRQPQNEADQTQRRRAFDRLIPNSPAGARRGNEGGNRRSNNAGQAAPQQRDRNPGDTDS